MLYALSTRHRKKTASVLLLVFYADMVIAGTPQSLHGKGYSIPETVSKGTIMYPKRVHLNSKATANNTDAFLINNINEIKQDRLKNEPEKLDNKPIVVHSGFKQEDYGGDPGQPEMQSFKSIGTDNMVDLFTGDFSYNIPLLDVGGYPVNIFYSSGITMDQEASWVGLGWNINPGTISRNMRGLPDDFDGTDQVVKKMNIKDDITVGANVGFTKEFAGFPAGKFSFGAGLFYNNYKGFGLEASSGLSVSDKAKDEKTHAVSPTAGLNIRFNSQQGATISPSLGVKIFSSDKETNTGLTASVGYNSRTGIQNLQLSGEMGKYIKEWNHTSSIGLFSGSLSFAQPSVTPSIRMPISRTNYNVGVSLGGEYTLAFASTTLSGYYSIGRIADIDKTQTKAAYGYLYMDKGQKDDNALMDFNRINDGVYTANTPVISFPAYTYDVYSMSGEGTGGSFRPYRGDVGYIKDHYSKTRDNAFSINGEVGFGNLFEAGVNLHAVFSPTEVQEWKTGNLARDAFKFHESDSIYQGVYFRNPSEKTIGNETFTKALGDDDLVRIKLGNLGTASPNTLPVLERFSDNRKFKDTTILNDYRTTKHQRDKRSQIITYLTAEEASRIGMDTTILSYPINSYPLGGCFASNITHIKRYQTGKETLRKRNHISEIDVLNPDGRRYVYGLPVYNISQEETTFALNQDSLPDNEQIVGYGDTENSTDNSQGKDHYYQSESLPPYAHSFLLTGLLSPDYVDVKGDGITEDDMGDAVKFNYSQISNGNNDINGFNWRAPFTKEERKASFNEGLKTDNYDNKASYTYGSRELWYLNSIESKNMVATFKLEDRWDAKEAKGKDGGVIVGGINQPGMKLLKQIDLYSKADKIKAENSGIPAKPIKTVHFAYSYKLCQETPSNINNTVGQKGKLTLDSIWFSYNGNNKQIENRYKFKYHSNPTYDRSANDRWGNYKPVKDPQNSSININPAGMNNADYPYSVQNKVKADEFAAAWCLNEVQLPSGGKINVTYEADDYAYVQNRRAQQMCSLAGFGATPGATPAAHLYSHSLFSNNDFLYLFIDTKTPGKTQKDADRYFEGIKQLYMKLYITMPKDLYGEGVESIPVYAEVDGKNYGVNPNNSQYLFVKILPVRGSISPMSSCVIQFLRDYLSSKAYPGSDIRIASGPKAVLLALKGLMKSVTGVFSDFENTARGKGLCNNVDINRSFIRLNNPAFQKLGGGLRVKKVEITDNWEEMTQKKVNNVVTEPGMQKATYGQEYDYTTTKEIDGVKVPISSGVATYEPGIGAEENPFREILRYSDKQPLGPTQNGAVEVPVGEMFYPSPMVGYSKVTVRSINRGNVKSGVGKQVTEFYTSKDFPVLSDFTDFDSQSKNNYKSNPILQLLKLDMRQTTTLSQGFRVQLNDMNGKIKTQSSFAEDTSTLITYTANFYRLQKKTDETYKLDNTLLAVKGPDGAVSQTQIGKDVEMMVDFREHTSKTITTNLDINVNSFAIPLPPGYIVVPSMVPMVSYEEAIYRSATLMKIVNQYGILDSVVSIDKGSQVTTKDLVYDGETGNVLLTRTNNEFNAPVYNFNYPAHWAYSGMHPAYRNIDLTYKGTTFRHGILLNSPQVNQDYFESGDELYVTDAGESWINDTEGCALVSYPNATCTPPQKILKSFEKRIWALDVRKDKTNAVRSFIFIDRDGKPYSADNVTFRIVRSGKRNMLNESVGSVTSRFSPLIIEAGQLKIKPRDNTDVLNTAATTYKDQWRVDNQFYIQSSLVETKTPATVYKITLYPESIFNMKGKRKIGESCCEDYQPYDNPGYFEAWKWDQGKRSPDYQSKSWMLFNFNQLPADATIIKSNLSLYAHLPKNIGCKSPVPVNHINFGHGVHNGQFAHYSEWGKVNASLLSRMTTPWYTPTSTAWRNVFLGSYVDNTTSRTLVTTTPNQSFSDADVPYLDVTNMVQAMNRDRNFYATGMSLSLINGPSQKNQMNMCFTGKDACNKPMLDIYYYSCNLALPRTDSTAQVADLSVSNAQLPPNTTYYCTTYEYQTQCLSTFNKQLINPYVRGILGNWRTERAYTYYGSRRDSTVLYSTDLRKSGAINNFKTYWNLDTDSLRTGSHSEVWVWNSEITQFNKRGFEIENHDPLGRFNSGLYGYAQALPVAVANNAKHREIAFDGFEDYGYSSTPCAEFCQPKRHMNIENAKAHISNLEAHTGKFSLQLVANDSVVVNSPIATIQQDTAAYSLRIHIDSNAITKNTYHLNGTGWTRTFFSNDFSGVPSLLNVKYINFTYDSFPKGSYSIIWKTIFLPTVSGWYSFQVTTDDGARLYITDNQGNLGNELIQLYNPTIDYYGNHGPYPVKANKYMNAGTPYYIELHYVNRKERGSANLLVQRPCDNSFADVLPLQVYLPANESLIPNAITTETLYCVKPDTIQPRGNFLTDTFSMLQGKKMVLGAWVKENKDCKCNSYANNQISLAFKDTNGNSITSSSSLTFTPTGPIIEGWQRYESEFMVPDNAKTCKMTLKNKGSAGSVFFDDIRIHPFNSNLKSFVYHPSNLRLMAELDENNYASFYEYDDDGTLVRVKKETIKGIKTINETRSALQKSVQ